MEELKYFLLLLLKVRMLFAFLPWPAPVPFTQCSFL